MPAEQQSWSERRQSPRLVFGTEAWIGDGRGRRSARVSNISVGGMVIEAAQALDPGGWADITLEGAAGHVTVRAEVRWIQQDDRAGSAGVRMGMKVDLGGGSWAALYDEFSRAAQGSVGTAA